MQIFFLGSLFFTIAALTRKLFIVYLQGVVVFLLYLILNAVFCGDEFTGALLVRDLRSHRPASVR